MLSTDDAEACETWLQRHMYVEEAVPFVLLGLDCEWVANFNGSDVPGGVSVVQLASATHCMVFSLGRGMPELLRRTLLDPRVLKVGKGLASDWRLLSSLLRPTDAPPASPVERSTARWIERWGWFELCDFLPFSSDHASMDSLSRTFLGSSYALKGSVDHSQWDRWPLTAEQVHYASSDACVIVDVLLAVADRERREVACLTSEDK